MSDKTSIADIRRDYGQLSLSEDHLFSSPIDQFESWFSTVLKTEKNDPTAMVLSTINDAGHPDSRVVLLKELKDEGFVFYTNYLSTKSLQMQANPYVALNFYWQELARQVRVRGKVRKISSERSDAYFSSRPRPSQLSAIASRQSMPLSGVSELQNALEKLNLKYQHEPISRPDFWGGYEVIADELEFWQGRDNRLHDRILYCRQLGKWHHHRLSP
ncbi:MAG: pyridoxamine 5'-phosphate oxidase [Legionellales bacterium]|nr:pyridoxamine 5'-phosphate oxidase [Legionellales bacterium]